MRCGLSPLSVHLPLAALQGAGADDFAAMLCGIKRYEMSSDRPAKLPLEEVWRCGEVSINAIPAYDYAAAQPNLLLVPSLVNKSTIFDIAADRSMMRWLAGQGINVYLLDWGMPIRDAGQDNMESLLAERLLPALRAAHDLAGQPVHALGYCMGGTLLAQVAEQARDYVRSLVFLASPWDFHAGGTDNGLRQQVQFWSPAAYRMIETHGLLDRRWLQSVFAALSPAVTMHKFSRFAKMAADDEGAALFVAVEDWLNDGVDLPPLLAQQFLQDWFADNALVAQKAKLDMQVLIIASKRDRLVCFESAVALQCNFPRARLCVPECGHIGMIAGDRAVKDVWTPIRDYLRTTV